MQERAGVELEKFCEKGGLIGCCVADVHAQDDQGRVDPHGDGGKASPE